MREEMDLRGSRSKSISPETRGDAKHLRRFWGVGLIGLLAFGLACSDSGSGSAGSEDKPNTASQPAATKEPETSASPDRTATPSPTPARGNSSGDTRSEAEVVEAGRAVYMGNCIACHNMNPAADGALGPAVAGASMELLESRVLRGEYPEGYTPKRPTRVMVPLPHLESRLKELAVYLNSL